MIKKRAYPRFTEDETLRQLRARPYGGWIRAARQAFGLSLKKVGRLLGISAQSVKDAETRELDGSISLGRLRDIAAAMDMELVYGFVPKGGSTEAVLRARAYRVAEQVYQRTYQTMLLEDQVPYGMEQRKEQEIAEIAALIEEENPDLLWTLPAN